MSESRIDPWMVLRTRSRHENKVETMLQEKQITAYLPKCKVTRNSNGRKTVVEIPLFPGYVFVRPRMDQFEGIRYIRGSCGLVLADSKPGTLPERDIEAVKKLVESGAELSIDPELVSGKRIKIVDGPFMGVEGILVSARNLQHLVVNVDMLGTSVRVEVDREAIQAS
jgi:transcription antitermination factor NusG